MTSFKAKYRVIPCEERPYCQHGPTVLFEQISNGKQYFACSANRDRKGCQFYVELEVFNKNPQKYMTPPKAVSVCDNKRLKKILMLSSFKRRFCAKCAKLLLPEEEKEHKDHTLQKGIPNSWMRHPLMRLLTSKTIDKQEAQYRFNRDTINFLLNTLQDKKLTRVICLGTPSLHESLQSHRLMKGKDVDSLLMDYDYRLAQFNISSRFVWFNMFNCFFFEGDVGENKLDHFIWKSKGTEIAIVVDPPFGGLIQLMADTIKFISKKISQLQGYQPKILLIMPIFFNPIIKDNLPSLSLSDYKVGYLNHPKYSKHSSPVRIFTNIPLKEFALPTDKYKFCSSCQRYVPVDVTHCKPCNDCVSFHGKPAKHCSLCNRCSGSTWNHCNICKRCYPQDHAHDGKRKNFDEDKSDRHNSTNTSKKNKTH